MASPSSRPFQVDLRGVVDLLSRHIYSSPQVYLRELLQNGRDAIRARRDLDPAAPAGEIEILPADDGVFRFRDNGVGLTSEEAADLLSTVGRSSKRDDVLQERREGYLGQFGIGLLSCFMVSDSIVVRSRSAKGAPAIEWVGDATGQFRIVELGEDETAALPVGTEITLRPRPDERALLASATTRRLAERFGRYLPVSVLVRASDGTWDRITREPEFLGVEEGEAPSEDLLRFGTDVLGQRPLDAIPLRVPGTRTAGVAFVLPFAPPPGARQANTVYLGRMLVGEQVADLLPDWAFFVRCVIDTDGLTPTASREGFIEGPALEHTREQLGATLRAWILKQASTRPWAFQRFLTVHALALKGIALHDDEFARVVLPWLTVETSAGPMTVGELARHDRVRFTETIDEFRQIAAVASAEQPIVNGGYVHDAALMRRLPDVLGVPVSRVLVGEMLDDLAPVPLTDRGAATDLESRATTALADVGCEVSTRAFAPAELPALCVVDPDAQGRIDREAAQREAGDGLWGDVLGDVGELIEARRRSEERSTHVVQLCLNWDNPLVRRLAGLRDELVFDRTLRLLYVQALLASHRPLSAADRRILTSSLADMVALSAGIDSTEGDPR